MGRAFEFRKARKFKRKQSAFACLDADGQEGKHAEGKRGKSYQACCIKRLH